MGFGNTMYGISGYVWVTGSSRPIFVKQEKEKLKRVLTDRQPLALFRDGPNRNRTLEQHFTRTWVTRTVTEAPK